MILVSTLLTTLVSLVTIGLGLWIGFTLDDRFETQKHVFTILAIVISVPLNLGLLLWVVRFTTRRYRLPMDDEKATQTESKEDATRV